MLLIKISNKGAFNEIYRRYWSSMYQAAFALIRDKDSCKDIIQEIFIWLWERRENVQIATLNSYLHTAVKFKVANHFRNGKIRNSFFQFENLRNEPCFTDDSLELKELKNIIAEFMSNLPARCREVFILSRNENLSHREIAVRLSISEKTVENQITSALRKLRMSLSRSFSSFFFFISLFLFQNFLY